MPKEYDIAPLVENLCKTFGASTEKNYVVVTVGVLICEDETEADVISEEVSQRISSETLDCPSGWVTFYGYGRKEDE